MTDNKKFRFFQVKLKLEVLKAASFLKTPAPSRNATKKEEKRINTF